MRILLADDNPNNQGLARRQLQRLGHTSRTAENGLEVLDLLRTDGPFDCILMDVNMPEMDGIEATRRIHQEYTDDSIRPPIIAVTANALQSNRDACFEAGMSGFLTKPLSMAVLREALEGVTGASPAPTTSASELSTAASEPSGNAFGEAPAGDIDLDQFDSIMEGGDAEAMEIFEDFCHSTVEMLDGMKILAEEGNAEAFAWLAHQLKGTFATFGLVALSGHMGGLEETAKSGSLAGLDANWWEHQSEQFAAAVEFLRARV
jgi:CheY-like chemotaxis protein